MKLNVQLHHTRHGASERSAGQRHRRAWIPQQTLASRLAERLGTDKASFEQQGQTICPGLISG